jgi:hypothetical protein
MCLIFSFNAIAKTLLREGMIMNPNKLNSFRISLLDSINRFRASSMFWSNIDESIEKVILIIKNSYINLEIYQISFLNVPSIIMEFN